MASTIKVDNVQNQPGTNIVSKCGTDVTIGASGDTVALAAGASQTGFGRTGTVDWVTTPKVTGDSPVTAATGSGYILNTTAGTITVNLPAGAAGSIVSVADYAATWQTNSVTVSPNGSEKMGGVNSDVTLSTEGQSVTFVYVDSTQGWINTMDSTSNVRGSNFIIATGGTIVTCGNFKTHVFTGPGTFCVSNAGGPTGSETIDYLVVAGGGAGGTNTGASGAGAGGFRVTNSVGCVPAPSMSPLVAPNSPSPAALPVSATGYPVAVGAGGTPVAPGGGNEGLSGNNSVFTGSSTITAAGGGGGVNQPNKVGITGGSGSGGKGGPTDSSGFAGGAGNTPPVSPSQGFPGGAGYDGVSYNTQGGGGGGAAVAGGDAFPVPGSAPGGDGSFVADAFIGPTAPSYGTAGPASGRYFAGGGGGAADAGATCTPYPGGAGGGGQGGKPSTPSADRSGTVNTGGGGGAGVPTCGGGGSGIVMIRYKFQ